MIVKQRCTGWKSDIVHGGRLPPSPHLAQHEVSYSFLEDPHIHPSQPLLVCSTFWVACAASWSSGPPTTGADVDVDVDSVLETLSDTLSRASCTAAVTLATPALTPELCPSASVCLNSASAAFLCSSNSFSSFQSPCNHHSSFDGAFLSAFFFSIASSSSAIPATSAVCAGDAVPAATAARAAPRILACSRSCSAK